MEPDLGGMFGVSGGRLLSVADLEGPLLNKAGSGSGKSSPPSVSTTGSVTARRKTLGVVTIPRSLSLQLLSFHPYNVGKSVDKMVCGGTRRW